VYKLIGGALIMISLTYVGFCAALFYKRRCERLKAFLALICHIEAQIDGYLTPVNSIFDSYRDKKLADTDFLKIAAEEGGSEAVRRLAHKLNLRKDELDELCAFFDGLGRGTAAEEIKHCRYFEKRFETLSWEASKELSGKMKIYKGLGILIGIMTVIILL